MQRADFIELFEIMRGLPVTIRLLDPPLHEFLPQEHEEIRALAEAMHLPQAQAITPFRLADVLLRARRPGQRLRPNRADRTRRPTARLQGPGRALFHEDAAALGLDPDGLVYDLLGEIDGVPQKAQRDAAAIPVTSLVAADRAAR